MSMQPHHGEIPEFRRRYRYLVVVVMVTFLVLLGRLWHLQAIQGRRYRSITEENFISELRIPTVRGLISDRQHRALVTNRPTYDVLVTPRFLTPASRLRLLRELGLDPEQAASLRRRIARAERTAPHVARAVLRDITRDQLAKLETNRAALRGITVQAAAHRQYLHGNLMAHVLGYLNEINREELRSQREANYLPGDMIGRFGVERMYEAHLRGVAGHQRIVVDAHGVRKRDAIADELLLADAQPRRVEPLPGHNVILTIDLDLQRLVERAMRAHRSGAAVVMEVNTGRVLASVSKPRFDPNVLTTGTDRKEIRRLVSDPDRPLLDKVVREHYFPGSTYKVIPAIAALEERLISPEDEFTCKGRHSFGRRSFRCGHAHGKTNLREAIIGSCNIYFYSLAEIVGMDRMARYARLFGLGSATGLGLNGEVAGFIPTKDWYRRRKQPFRVGYTLNTAIGQGNTKVTPIQLASVYATIANGGNLYLPQIVERIETQDGMVVFSFAPRLRRHVRLRHETLALIHDALAGVVADPDGTAHEMRVDDMTVAGKTGTAQVNRRGPDGKTIWLNDHSWFASYAPVQRPEIAVVVLIEYGGRAAKVAAPVAMEITRAYFRHVRAKRTAAAAPPTPPVTR